ncbi:hypothetical protein EDB81DRAFT_310643 [Dactylonectria macrodidyma]|uniref:Uncharacterized protein n=1 Tax=Dactylonectria macrodidyma TaxID=307937 RepID=A0A9P9D5P4_9HYPO|nr:hypothetical protein EDB81DRAFT_310643 [Dactylonectria macrodidyma]
MSCLTFQAGIGTQPVLVLCYLPAMCHSLFPPLAYRLLPFLNHSSAWVNALWQGRPLILVWFPLQFRGAMPTSSIVRVQD